MGCLPFCPLVAAALAIVHIPLGLASYLDSHGRSFPVLFCLDSHGRSFPVLFFIIEEGILLLGDAAHAVSPSVGQGCNAALQDVQVFCGLLDQFEDDWDRVLPVYTAARLTDAHAVSEISDFSNPRTPWMKTELLIRLILRKLLPAFLAAWVLRPMPMELVVETTLSYNEVLQKTKWWIDRVRASAPPLPLSPGEN